MNWKRKPTKNTNPFIDGVVHRHGQKSEARTLKEMGARQTIASGSIPGLKSDGVMDKFRIECKATIHQSISVKLEWLKKIRKEALETNRCPVLTITFVDSEGNPDQYGGEWAMIPQYLFNDFAEWLEKNGG